MHISEFIRQSQADYIRITNTKLKRNVYKVAYTICKQTNTNELLLEPYIDALYFYLKKLGKPITKEVLKDVLVPILHPRQGIIYIDQDAINNYEVKDNIETWTILYLFYTYIDNQHVYTTKELLEMLSQKIHGNLTLVSLRNSLNTLCKLKAVVRIDYMISGMKHLYWGHPDIIPYLESYSFIERVDNSYRFIVRSPNRWR